MGIFDLFKSKGKLNSSEPIKEPERKSDSLTNFNCFYLFGLTDNPNRQSNDVKSFENLYENVIGNIGGIIIGNSFHPYQIINPPLARASRSCQQYISS